MVTLQKKVWYFEILFAQCELTNWNNKGGSRIKAEKSWYGMESFLERKFHVKL